MNKRQSLLLSLFLFTVILLVPRVSFAATLQFDPASTKCTLSGLCKIDIKLDAGADDILATDARFTYPKNLLEVQTIDDGKFLTIGKKDFSTPGEVYIAGIVDDPASAVKGSGVLATVTFKGLTSGTATLAFTCKPGETASDSNIAKNDLNATDIIQCSDNGTAIITVGSGVGGADTSTTTTTTSSSSTSSSSTPSSLPRTGFYDEMIKFAVPGTILVIIGVGLRLLF